METKVIEDKAAEIKELETRGRLSGAMEEGTLARKEDILRQSLLRGNLRGTSGDQGKDHVRPRKRPKRGRAKGREAGGFL